MTLRSRLHTSSEASKVDASTSNGDASEVAGMVRHVDANAHLKRRWDSQLASATSVSVIVHLLLFAFLPGMRLGVGYLDPEQMLDPGLGGILLVAPFAEQGGEAAGTPPVAAAAVGDPEGTGAVAGDFAGSLEGPIVSDLEPGALWDAVGDRLRRGRTMVPALSVPVTVGTEPQSPGVRQPEPEPVEDDLPEIESDVTTIELADLPASDSLDLGRLTGLRPELAFMTASAWVLIRNQEEVEAYLRRTYREGVLDPAIAGSVSVTLWIDQQGAVEWAEVSQSSGRTDLDEVALALFNEVADFRAARERGDAVSRSVTFSLNFPW
ncbi:MAG: TonB family protein [Gemmatimonadetes bacterium]|nr:TonB family protein [Gemmatimonadota bacterium]